MGRFLRESTVKQFASFISIPYYNYDNVGGGGTLNNCCTTPMPFSGSEQRYYQRSPVRERSSRQFPFAAKRRLA